MSDQKEDYVNGIEERRNRKDEIGVADDREKDILGQ